MLSCRGKLLARAFVSAFLQNPSTPPKTTKQIIDENVAEGRDPSAMLSREFLDIQCRMWQYRVQRMSLEWAEVKKNPIACLPETRDLPKRLAPVLLVFLLSWYCFRQGVLYYYPPPLD